MQVQCSHLFFPYQRGKIKVDENPTQARLGCSYRDIDDKIDVLVVASSQVSFDHLLENIFAGKYL